MCCIRGICILALGANVSASLTFHPVHVYYPVFIVILTKNVLTIAQTKFQRGQHSEIYLLTLKEQDKTKMELHFGIISKHAFWYL